MSTDGIDAYCVKAASFWKDYGFNLVWWFLAIALALAIVAGVLGAIEKMVMMRKVGKASVSDMRLLAGSIDTGVLDAISGIIDSLVKAPTWFALFLAGLALAWGGASAMADACKPPPAEESILETQTEDAQVNPEMGGKQPGRASLNRGNAARRSLAQR